MPKPRRPEFEEYRADVHITYGGIWVKDEGTNSEVVAVEETEHADVVRVVLARVALPDLETVRRALTFSDRACYFSVAPEDRRLYLLGVLYEYGCYDTESERYIATAPYIKGWRGERLTAFVDGEAGLRQFLVDEYGLDCVAPETTVPHVVVKVSEGAKYVGAYADPDVDVTVVYYPLLCDEGLVVQHVRSQSTVRMPTGVRGALRAHPFNLDNNR